MTTEMFYSILLVGLGALITLVVEALGKDNSKLRDVILRLAIGIRSGTTRHCIPLTKRYVVKVPNVTEGWEMFLCGLLGNIQEVKFHNSHPALCPITFGLWGGWFIVMRRATILTEAEFEKYVTQDWQDRQQEEMEFPCEWKSSSFGWLEGKIVCVDYGS